MRLNYFHNRPKVAKINVDTYLERIQENRESVSLGYLKKLHRSHLIHIPFENLDIHYGSKIQLDYIKIFDKIVTNGRGGFCYELNGLFYHLLSHLGFECYPISAKVKSSRTGELGRDFDHMTIVVMFEGEAWLADVGFGEGFIYPKRIIENEIQIDFTTYWRIITDPDENLILQLSSDSNHFETKYQFTTDEKQLIQFMEMCEYHQTSPMSHFTQGKLITRLTPEGRIVLTDRKLTIKELGETNEIPMMNEDEFLSKLDQHFNIKFDQLIPRKT